MTDRNDGSRQSDHQDITVNSPAGAPLGPMWFVLGLLVFAVAALGILLVETGPGNSRLAADISIERGQDAGQPPARRDGDTNGGGIDIQGSIEVPRDTGGAGQ